MWVVKKMALVNDNIATYGGKITAVINGTTYYLYEETMIQTRVYGGNVPNELILKGGDSLYTDPTYDVVIFYWKANIDMKVPQEVPPYRYTNLTSAGNVTVPVGETWVVKLVCSQFVKTSGVETHNIRISTNGVVSNNLCVTTAGYSFAYTYITRSFILHAGDYIQWLASGGSGTRLLQVGYWILEQDTIFEELL
ncbi:MAG: hypothetical protein GWN64_07985 [Candidatus Thorarchaeota archaeon]|nr:hypothetical protein [Candidatus Thorarchaeota archaeon]